MTTTSATPMASGDDDRPLLLGTGHACTLGRFAARVRALAATLPEARHAINLCESRDRFLVAFCAAAVRGQTTLLPPSRAPETIVDIRTRYPSTYLIGDAGTKLAADVYLADVMAEVPGAMPAIDDAMVVAIGFTSGSTGVPGANPKTWGSVRASTAQNIEALHDLWDGDAIASVVATVPPQHMYGMEMSVLLPLLGPVAVHAGRPFFPHDIAAALREVPAPRILVTTPVHLRAVVESGVELPPLAAILTATAPLPPELARTAEQRFGGEVRELFGSTETCVIARRRTAIEQAWTLYPGVTLVPGAEGTTVERVSLVAPVQLADIVELDDAGRRFELRGRHADLLEIAGKRASLGDLGRILQAIPGVRDGVVVQGLQADASGTRRLVAIIEADPTLADAAVLEAFRTATDPVFVPRRIIRVPQLPRNETGKLPRAALEALLARP